MREGSNKSARFVQGRERRKVEREREWKKSSEKGESPVGEENGRAIGNAPHQEGGQSGKRHAIAYGRGQEWQQGTGRCGG